MRKMFNSKFVSMLMAILITVMLVGNAAPAVSFAEEYSEDVTGLRNNLEDTTTLVDVKEYNQEWGNVFVYHGKFEFTKEEAESIASEMIVENNTNGIFELEVRQQERRDGTYRVYLAHKVTSDVVGAEGSFTVKYKEFEKTYDVKLIDYDNTIKEFAHYWAGSPSPFERDENGDILIETYVDASRLNFYRLDIVNYRSADVEKSMSELGLVDLNQIYIDERVNMQDQTPDNLLGYDLEVGSIGYAYIYADNGQVGILLLPERTGEGWFTLNYGDFSERVHVVAKESTGYPSSIDLDSYEISAKTGETVTINATINPANAFTPSANWYVFSVTDDRGKCRIMKSDTSHAEIIFGEPGVYTVQMRLLVNRDYDSQQDLKSALCTITVTGEEVELPEAPAKIHSFVRSTSSNSDENLWVYMSGAPSNVTDAIIKVWCDTNGKDDLKEYQLTNTNPADGEWQIRIDISDHKEVGIYHFEYYGMVDGQQVLLTEEQYMVTQQFVEFEPNPTIEPTPTPTPLPANTYYMGDVDKDGEVAAIDALSVLKHVVKLSVLENDALTLADMDNNNSIEATDALEILKVVVKLASTTTIQLEISPNEEATTEPSIDFTEVSITNDISSTVQQ